MSGATTSTLFVDIALIALVARAIGELTRRLGQPAVIGEIFAGVLLGPTLFHGSVSHRLFPTDVRPLLSALAQLGVVCFMFCVGLELDQQLLRRRGRSFGAVSIGSIVLPAGLGAIVAVALAPRYAGHDRVAFVLFMSAAMAVTAFPVLARILADRGMVSTHVGQIALGCAAANDVVAWIVLAIAAATSRAGGDSAWHLTLLAPYLIAMVALMRPLLAALTRAGVLVAGNPARVLGLVMPLLLGSAAATSWIGLSPVFGAFLFGAAMPRESRAAIQQLIRAGVEDLARVLLLPIFFVTAGLNVNLNQLGGGAIADLGLIMLSAVGGKFLGTVLAARASGMQARDCLGLGTLMNTRGLTELIVLTVGLELGVINREMYSLMVVMALLTTAMAGPLLRVLYPPASDARDAGYQKEPPARVPSASSSSAVRV